MTSVSSSSTSVRQPEPKAAGKRVLIAASGTGGHIFPALHIARAIKSQDPEAVVEFVGSGRPLEEKLIDGAGFKRHVLSVSAVKQRGIRGLFKFVFGSPAAFKAAKRLLQDHKVGAVIGVGGYVTVMPVLAAYRLGIPTWIHEAELKPGLANWLLSYFATVTSTGFRTASMPRWARVEFTGHPVRAELAKVDRNRTPQGGAPKRLLVMGGSQGARALDTTLGDLAPVLATKGIEVVHQCRPENSEELSKRYKAASVKAHIVPFIEDMAGAYEWCDVIVSRSGAGSVMEIATVNRPAIFVPYPHQQGTHQTDNARTLVAAGKAILCEEGEGFEGRFARALEQILDPERFMELKKASLPDRNIDAAERIARSVLGLAQKR